MIAKAKILVFCMIFVVIGAFAQKNQPLAGVQMKGKPVQYWYTAFIHQPAAPVPCPGAAQNFPAVRAYYLLPANQYAKNLSFFCKNEWHFEKATGIPLRVRLGSVQQCDWLEGKSTQLMLPR